MTAKEDHVLGVGSSAGASGELALIAGALDKLEKAGLVSILPVFMD